MGGATLAPPRGGCGGIRDRPPATPYLHTPVSYLSLIPDGLPLQLRKLTFRILARGSLSSPCISTILFPGPAYYEAAGAYSVLPWILFRVGRVGKKIRISEQVVMQAALTVLGLGLFVCLVWSWENLASLVPIKG